MASLVTSAVSNAIYRALSTHPVCGESLCCAGVHRQPCSWGKAAHPICSMDHLPQTEPQKRGDRLLAFKQKQSDSLGSHFHCVPNNLCHPKLLGAGENHSRRTHHEDAVLNILE